ncbi:MAG: right-handed parallel beta-helix repeat-containing protein [Bacteroidales bacterium]|nr:right-handed parallel beta-helix repeat-containing protein [Bacteroidales bacterium]MCF8456426.1 right-handed parallel beta-helix repeat-containing protein [Bacteroidales bacterium]
MKRNFTFKMKHLFLLLLIFVVGKVSFSQGPLAGIYTIGSTPGYLTFGDAVDSLNANGVSGPVVFEVAPGTYTEQVTIPTIAGVDSINTITITSQNGDSTSVSLQWNTDTGADLMIFILDHCDYVTIKNITIKSTSTGNNGQIFRLYGSSHINILNNVLQGPSLTSDGTSAIVIAQEGGNGACSNVTIANNKLLNGKNAIYYLGSATVNHENVTIENNIVDGFYGKAIQASQHENLTFRNNYVHNGSSVSATLNVLDFGSCYDGLLVENNRLVIDGIAEVQGIRLTGTIGTANNPSLIANNFISVTGATGSSYGFFVENSSHINIYNNSVNMVGGSALAAACYVDQPATAGYGNIRLTNNIFANTNIGYAIYVTDNAMSPGMITYSDYNNYFSTGATAVQFGVWNASAPANLNLIEPHSKLVSPVFASPTNLHCYSPFLMTSGKPLSSVQFDIDGEARDPLNPSIGADEFDLFMVDAGVSGFVGLGVLCPGTTDIFITINNFGLIDLTQVTVDWSVNGVAQQSVLVTDTISVGGSLNFNMGTYTFLSGMTYDLVGSTSMPNGIVDLNTLNDGASNLGIQTAAAGTYTIGATGDFISIGAAQQFIQLYGVCGPVVFNILPGTYNEQVSLVEVTGVDATNTVTWQSSTGNNTDVIVQYSASGNNDNWVWAFDGADYNIVQNITIKSNTSTNYGRVVIFQNTSNHNIVNGNIIESINTTNSNAAAIRSYSDSKDEFNIISGNTVIGGYYGIYWYSNSSNLEEGNQFLNNTIDMYYYYGMYNYYQYATTISGNYIYQDPNGNNSNYPFYVSYCDGPIVVTNNKIFDDAGTVFYGLRIYYCDATPTAPGLVANNWVYNDGNTGTTYGLYLYYSNYINVYHNSVNINSGGTTYGAYIYGSSSSGNYTFLNNSIVNKTGGRALYGTANIINSLISSNNNLYTTGASLCYFSSDYPTITDWQAVSPGDVLNTDGSYLSSTDLHSNSLDLDGAAIPVSEVTTDIDGESRDPLTPDVGADEYTLANNDAAITGLPGINANCPGVTDIVANVSNYGLVALNSVVINWMVNGVFQAPLSYTTTIPIGGSADVVIGNYNLLAGTTYDFTVWSSLPNNSIDPNSGNDSLIVTGVTTAVSGNFTIGATGDFTTFGDAVNFISTNGVCGPVIVNVESGTYDEQVTIPEIPGASAFNTITFQSATGNYNDVTVQYSASSNADNWVFMLDGADYVTVQNIYLEAYGTANQGYVVVLDGGSDFNTFSNCYIKSKSNTNNKNACVYSYSSSCDNYNTFIGNYFQDGYYSVYLFAASSAPEYGNALINNTMHDYYSYGVYTNYEFEVNVDGNLVHQRVNGYSTNYGIDLRYSDGPIRAVNNIIYDDAGSTFYGIRIYSCDATSAAPALVANNMISNNGNTGNVYGLYLYYSNYINVYHNSVAIYTGSTVFACYFYGSATSGIFDFKNNSIANFDGGRALYGNSAVLPGITSSNNNLYTTGNSLCYFTADYPTLSDWQTVSPGDVLSVDPEHISANDLHTFSLYLNASATPVPEVTTDIDANPRNPLTPDIGADEFNLLLPPNDIAIERLYYYGEVPIEGGAEVVSVLVTNVGSADQVNLPVTLTITGANTFASTITLPLLTSGAVDTVYFAPFTPTIVGFDSLVVSVPNDADNSNNQLTGIHQATQNTFAYADTSGSVGYGGAQTGRIYQTKYYLNGLKQINAIQVYITDDPNNAGNSVYGVVLDANHNILANGDTIVLDASHYNTWLTLPITNPAATTMSNTEFQAGFAQIPPVAGNYQPIGYQDEIPMRWDAYYYSDLNGSNLTEFTNDRRWMIKATTTDPAPWDAACVSIPEPLGDCGLGVEPVTIKIHNFGSNTISGNLTAYYQLNNNTVVSQAVTNTLLSNDTLLFSFTTPVDLTVTSDSIFNLTAWVTLTGDLNQNNDTAFATVESLYQPSAPVAVNTTVLYGSMATISVISTDSISWYDDPLSTTPLASGNNLTIGPLFDTAIFYAQAGGSGSSGLAITEMDMGTYDVIEIQNLTGSTLDATGWVVAISDSYTDITAINSTYWNLGVFAADEVQIRTDQSGSLDYWGGNMYWNQGAPPTFRGWAMIVDGQGEIVDMMIWGWTAAEIAAWTPTINGFAVNPSSAWNGDAMMNYPNPFLRRINYDDDVVADWTNPTTDDLGFPNVGMNISTSFGSCTSDMVPVTAYVVNIPANDIGVVGAYSPVSATNLGNAEIVSVEINNWGSLPANLFQITYDITGTTSSTVTELVAFTTPIASGTSSTFTFNTPTDLSAYGAYHFDVYTQLFSDGFPANDTLSFTVVNLPPVFCSSGATNNGNEEIVQVDLSNISNYSFPSGSLYSNYNNSVAPGALVLGNAHPISITSGFAPGSSTQYSCWVEVYVDWNNDGVYTEPQETALSSAITSSQTVTGMLSVPTSAALGNHSMRVVLEQTTSATGVVPCGSYTYGETEDYQVFVQPPYATDAGAIAILSPTVYLLENTSHLVEVVVNNYGTDTIYSMDVVYTVNGLNPVTTAYIGALPSFESDTLSLGNLIVPGGNFELCAYTVLINDSNTLNDATCTTLFADPQFDLAMLNIVAPIEGCDLGLEDVTITFVNIADTIFGNIPVSYYEPGMVSPVTETYTGILNPGDTATYTFSTQIDLAVALQTEFAISAWLSYTGDPIQTNDTAFATLLSDVSPAAPMANDITIWAGTSGTLNVINPDSTLNYEWFDATNVSMGTETFFTTPVLFDTTSYFVQASSNTLESNELFTTMASGNGSSGVMFDVTAFDELTIDSFFINCDNVGIMEVWYKEGAYLGFQNTQSAWTLAGSANVQFAGTTANSLLTIGGITIPAGETYGIYITYVTGSGKNYTNGNGINEIYQNNDMKIECGHGGSYFNLTNTPRVFNGTVFYSAGAAGCGSDLTPVNVNVQYAIYDGAVLDITSPVSASNMNNAAVTIDIYNNGLLDLSSFNVQYTLNGGAPVTQLVTATIVPGQVYSFTFTDSVNVSVFGTYSICASTEVSGDGYPANNEYCTVFSNWDGNGESCATAFPYLALNDPPVYQTTIHPYDRQWWRFELPVDAIDVDVSLCGSLFDTKLEVHDQCPVNSFLTSSYLGYNNNSCGQQSNVHFNMLSAGTYYAKVYGFQGEYGDYVLEITGTFADIAVANFSVSNIQCNGAANGSVVASVAPIIPGATLPLTYEWSTGATGLALNGLGPGTYTLTITDGQGISQVESVTITEPPALSLSLAGSDVTTLGGQDGTITATISGGTSPYTFVWSNGASTQNLDSIHAGIYTLIVYDANGCSIEEVITINSPLPPGWTVTPTTNSHLIIVDQNSSIMLDGMNAAYGSLLGVFYNSNGTMVCGGWTYWSGMSTSLTAYGSTTGQDNGFNPGETFTWRLYEAALGVEYGGPACYIASYPNQGTYITGGFSGINCLNAQSIILQPIDLPLGWSIWSTYVDPVNPNMVAIFDSIASNVTIVKSGSGTIYWPLYNLNTIGNAVMGQGYQIKMSTAKILHVQGLQIDPVVSPINIPGGWSIMGYLRTTPMNAATVMSPIVSQIIIVKSGGGQIYWPLYGLNTIGNMVPGHGYQIKMLSLQSFTFPANTAAPTKSNGMLVQPEKYNKVKNTGHNMSLGILEDAWNAAPQVDDEIGVYNAKGELIGSTVYQDGFNAITIWGDDSFTEDRTEGIANGDVFTLKLWSFTRNTEQELVVESWLQGNDQYGKDAISVIEKLKVIGEEFDGFKLYQNVPNPFRDATEISFNLPEASHVRLSVYNALGEIIEELVSARYDAGKYSVQFETGNLSSGTYFYKIVCDKFTDTKVMNIQ